MSDSHRMAAGLTLVLALILPGVAVTEARTSDQASDSRVEQSLHKLGRGLTNISTAVFEIPRMTTHAADESGWITASTIGLVKGIWFGVLRAVTGVFEVVTFPLEIPKDYGPLLEPEFVFEGF